MLTHRATLSLLTIGAALTLAGCSGAGPAGGGEDELTGDKIVLAVVTDITGPYSSLTGTSSIAAVQLAVDDFNEAHPDSGFADKIEVISADTKNDPAVANTSAQRMLSQGADVFIDVPNSAAALAVSKVAESNKKPMLAVSAGPTALVGAECNPYSYVWSATAQVYGNAVGRYVTENGGKTWYVPYPDYAFGSDYNAALVTAVEESGGDVLASDATPFPNENYSSVMLKAKSLNPDVLMLIQGGSDLANAVTAYHQFGLDTAGIRLAVGALSQGDIDAIGPDEMAGTVSAVPFYWNRDDESRAFTEKFRKVSGGAVPTVSNAGSYSAALQYLEAVLRAGSDDGTNVVEALDGTTFSDVFARNAEVRAADHSVVKDLFITEVQATSPDRDAHDSVDIVGTVPAADAWPAASSACNQK